MRRSTNDPRPPEVTAPHVRAAESSVDWFAARKTPSRLDVKVTKRLTGVLRRARDSPSVPEPLRTQARTALEKGRVGADPK